MKRNALLFLIAVVAVSYFGLTILILSLISTDVNPITQVASLYGIGPYAVEMNLGFLIGGIGLIAFALAAAQISRVGALILSIDGLVLIVDSYFTTSPEGAPATLHNTIHSLGGAIYFFTAWVGIIMVSRKLGRRTFLPILAAIVFGIIFEIASSVLSAGGLGERVLLGAIFSSIVAGSLSLLIKSQSNRRASSPLPLQA